MEDCIKEDKLTESFNKRLCMAISDMPNPVKDTKAYNYKYETLDQVLAIVQEALTKHGLFVMQGIEYGADGYELRTIVHDTEGGIECKVMDSRPVKFTGDSQKDGSSETYARRYALKTVFGLCGEDDDGAAASHRQPVKERYAKPVAKKQKPAAKAATEPCAEYSEMLKVFAEYVEITGEGKADAWKRFHGAQVAKDDAAMCIAVIADIEQALNG